MNDTAVIEQGREAWQRIRSQDRMTWDDWIAVGRALVVGRVVCMKAAQVNEPKGGRYNHITARWLAENGFSDVCAQERYRVCKIVENLAEVERWRDALPLEHRRRINHPSHWQSFCRFKKGQARQVRHPRPAPSTVPVASGRPVYWSQDCIRRAALAMKESRSCDWFQLARVGLEAAIANDVDLVALLDPPKLVYGATPLHTTLRP